GVRKAHREIAPQPHRPQALMQQHEGRGFIRTGADHLVFEPACSDVEKAVVGQFHFVRSWHVPMKSRVGWAKSPAEAYDSHPSVARLCPRGQTARSDSVGKGASEAVRVALCSDAPLPTLPVISLDRKQALYPEIPMPDCGIGCLAP